MEELILITYLNDFIFCPISIYYHRLYGNKNEMIYQRNFQREGKIAHKSIDNSKYSTRKNILQGLEVFSKQLNVIGKIDIYDKDKHTLIERKNIIKNIYDGYIYQVYAQFFCLTEMGYEVKKIELYSLKDNKKYKIKLPKEDPIMYEKFCNIINDINSTDINSYIPTNSEKCKNCIYEPLCDRSLLC